MPPIIVDQQKVSAFKAAVESLTSDDVAVIIHDYDADGVCSGLLMRNLLRDRGIIVKDMVSHVNRALVLHPAHIERIAASKPTIIFSTDIDLASVQGFDVLYERLNIRFVIQDHHAVNPAYEHLDRVLYINPILMTDSHEGSQYCSAKFVYDMASFVQDMSKYKYLAALGILGDNNAVTWQNFMLDFMQQEKLNVTINHPEDWYNTILSKPMGLLFCATAIDQEAFENVLKIFQEAESLQDLLEAAKHNPYDYVQKELSMYLQKYNDHLVHDDELNLNIVRIDSQYHIASVLSTIISQKDRDGIWLVLHPQAHVMRINARNQSSHVHLGKILREVCGRFPEGNGGGHAPAAGGKVRLEDVDRFLAAFKQEVREYKNHG